MTLHVLKRENTLSTSTVDYSSKSVYIATSAHGTKLSWILAVFADNSALVLLAMSYPVRLLLMTKKRIRELRVNP